MGASETSPVRALHAAGQGETARDPISTFRRSYPFPCTNSACDHHPIIPPTCRTCAGGLLLPCPYPVPICFCGGALAARQHTYVQVVLTSHSWYFFVMSLRFGVTHGVGMSQLFNAPRALTVTSAAIPVLAGQPALVPLKLKGLEGCLNAGSRCKRRMRSTSWAELATTSISTPLSAWS